ncbi:RNA polymerase sigma factor SigX [Pontibacillus halophilus JSM 076056 = DSM 19796]|uniref:RNA polymerase sigma factor n=1 Tax=Pontibacillus halophilus JSM 076056 = DSM 19796 TaxID=1385510 RepID=A0A0A5GG24_9BACI|nr:RNA polymerase sigma factor SigX [Pontibacillus halophilus]KGX92201.1 RNA polymerase sigma factor SigX [Pontibacillus halophilus JSM 076056 = DSM 19796]
MSNLFDRLYDHYHQDLFQFIYYMVKDREATEDLIQEVYVKVMKSYSSFKGESSEKTWLFSIAKHVTFDHFRKQKRLKDRIYDLFDMGERGQTIRDPEPLPEELVMKSDEVKELYYHLDTCSPNQRSVLILRYIQERSIKETAAILNWSESKVKTTQHRGLRALKQSWDGTTEGGEKID